MTRRRPQLGTPAHTTDERAKSPRTQGTGHGAQPLHPGVGPARDPQAGGARTPKGEAWPGGTGLSPPPRERLTPGGGAGDDEAGGFAEPVRHGAGRGRARRRRRRRRSSPHAAAPRMRSAGRAGDARAASGGGWAKRAAVPEGETLRGAASWDGDGGCEGLGGRGAF